MNDNETVDVVTAQRTPLLVRNSKCGIKSLASSSVARHRVSREIVKSFHARSGGSRSLSTGGFAVNLPPLPSRAGSGSDEA